MGIRFKNLVIFILINLTFSIRVYANILKDISFEKISINEGLSNEYVTTIFQDSKGYMWIGTKDGLNRYDGQIIKIYNCNADNINTLSSTNINDIEEDVYGNIWVATDDGLDFILTDTDKVVRLKDISKEDNLGRTNITVLLKSEYEENIMWVGTETGLFRIDVKSKEVRYFDDNSNEDNALVDSAITSLVETEENSLWVGSKKGINIIDEDLKVTNVDNINLDEEKTFITHMSKDNKGNLWLSTKKGVFFII